jgi:hypothetical protein
LFDLCCSFVFCHSHCLDARLAAEAEAEAAQVAGQAMLAEAAAAAGQALRLAVARRPAEVEAAGSALQTQLAAAEAALAKKTRKRKTPVELLAIDPVRPHLGPLPTPRPGRGEAAEGKQPGGTLVVCLSKKNLMIPRLLVDAAEPAPSPALSPSVPSFLDEKGQVWTEGTRLYVGWRHMVERQLRVCLGIHQAVEGGKYPRVVGFFAVHPDSESVLAPDHKKPSSDKPLIALLLRGSVLEVFLLFETDLFAFVSWIFF